MSLISVAEGLWTTTREMRFPGGVRLPLRMTIVRIEGGGLVCCSLVRPDDALFDEIAALGPVHDLVGPNLYHHLFLGPFHERFPGARLLGAPGLAAKRPKLPFAGELGDDAPAEWRGHLSTVAIRGAPKIGEVALFHRPSATLIVVDLLFHVLAPAGWATAFALAMMGTRGRLGRSRSWWLLRKDRAAWAESVERVLAWPFRRVLVAHGEILEADDAPARVRQVLRGA